MFSVLDSLESRGMSAHVAWRVSFVVVPFIIVVAMALCILFLCPDTPTGAWKDRHINQNTVAALEPASAPTGRVVDVADYKLTATAGDITPRNTSEAEKAEGELPSKRRGSAIYDVLDVKAAEATLVQKPTVVDFFKVALSLPTITQCACYFVSFGCELSLNGILSAFYIEASGTPAWSQSYAGDWAAMYGLLNVVTRPLGGYIADNLYHHVGVEGKKFFMIICMALYCNFSNLQVLVSKELF